MNEPGKPTYIEFGADLFRKLWIPHFDVRYGDLINQTLLLCIHHAGKYRMTLLPGWVIRVLLISFSRHFIYQLYTPAFILLTNCSSRINPYQPGPTRGAF